MQPLSSMLWIYSQSSQNKIKIGRSSTRALVDSSLLQESPKVSLSDELVYQGIIIENRSLTSLKPLGVFLDSLDI